MTSNLISIIIPTYQHAKALDKCLNSIFNQTYKNVEVIVVNDGSTDDTSKVLAPYLSKITLLQQENRGANAARNRGFQESKGEFVLFCDADVVMKPHMLATLLEALEKQPSAAYSYSAFRFGWKLFRGLPFDPELLRTRNFIHTGALIRKNRFPGFDINILRLQDWDLWLTMLERGSVGVLAPGVLCRVRIYGASRIGSAWRPAWFYNLPWKFFGFIPESVSAYTKARAIIYKKHHLL